MTHIDDTLTYGADHASPPGHLILEYMEEHDLSARELARRCGRSGKLMSEITSGKAPVEPETALQLERVLGVHASIWTNMEAAYQLQLARQNDMQALEAQYGWATKFPLKDLIERKYVTKSAPKSQQVQELLKFFGAGTPKACDERMGELLMVDYLTTPAFENDTHALAAWLRIGEMKANAAPAADYNKDMFLQMLRKVRSLTLTPINEALPEIVNLCAAGGVVFVLEKPFSKVRASGISRWLSPRKALIQQSFRHKSDDHFWFTFFHECAHILLHSRKEVFIDMPKGPGSADPKQEAEANLWSAEFLIPNSSFRRFISTFGHTEAEVRAFAEECGVAPGIVVGQLQHNQIIGFNVLNHLKMRYEWTA